MKRTTHTRFLQARDCLCIAASMIAALSFIGPCAGAEDAAQAKLSLSGAIAQALDINPNLRRAEENRAASKSRLRVAGIKTSFDIGTTAGLLRSSDSSERSGRMFGQVTYENQIGTRMSLDLAPFATGTDRGALGITLRHPMMKGKGLFSNKSNTLIGARLDSTIQEKQLYLARQSTVQNVAEAYFRAVQAREQVGVQERALETAKVAADGASERAKELQVTEIEVSRAKIRVAQTDDQLNIQRQSAQGAVDRLMIAIGEGVGKTPVLIDTVPEADFEIPSLQDAIKTALENRSELSIYDMQLSDQERLLAARQDSLRPSLDVVAGFNSINSDTGLISRSLYDLGSFTAGIEYRLPVDRRALEEERDTTSRNLDVLRKLRVYQMEQIAESVRNAYRAVEASRTSVGILGQNVEVAKSNLALAQEMLDEGLDDNRNVLDGQEALTRAESGLLSAKVDLFLAGVNLKYAMGEDLATIGL